MNSQKSFLDSLKKRESGLRNNIVEYFLSSKINSFEVSTKCFKTVFHSPVNKIALEKQDCRYLLSGYNNGKIAIFDTQTQRSTNIIRNIALCNNKKTMHQSHIVDLIWYPLDTGLFMSLGADRKLKIWDANELEIADEYNFPFDVHSMSISEKAKKRSLISVACADSTVSLCDLRTGSKTHVLKEHPSSVICVKWSPRTENILISGCSSGYLKAWDVRKTRSSLQTLAPQCNGIQSSTNQNHSKAHNYAITGLAFSPEGYQLLSFGKDNRLILWDLWTGENVDIDFGRISNTSKQTTVQMCFATFSSSIKIAFIPSGNSIQLFDITKGFCNKLNGHFANVNSCLFDNVNNILYSAANDYQILLWDMWGRICNDPAYSDNWSDDEIYLQNFV